VSPILGAIAAFPAISLADLDTTWSLTRRFDTKFMVERSVADKFLSESTANFTALEIDGARAFTYRTTYYDTPDLLLYRDHAQRRTRRVKVRNRLYVESQRTRLEVKAKRGNGQTHKILFEDRAELGPLEIPQVDHAISEIYPTARYSNLAPELIQSAVTTFERSTIVNHNGAERMTIDSSLMLDSNGKRFELLPELVLVEVKSLTHSSETVRRLRKLGIHPTSFSKYCAAIEAAHDVRPRVHRESTLLHKLRATS
jgi:hypothetical protein